MHPLVSVATTKMGEIGTVSTTNVDAVLPSDHSNDSKASLKLTVIGCPQNSIGFTGEILTGMGVVSSTSKVSEIARQPFISRPEAYINPGLLTVMVEEIVCPVDHSNSNKTAFDDTVIGPLQRLSSAALETSVNVGLSHVKGPTGVLV